MPSFRITLSPGRKAAVHFIGKVRRQLQEALTVEKRERNLKQSDVARAIGVDRSVISREVNGERDLTLGRLAELAYAMNREPYFEFRKIETEALCNEPSVFHSPDAKGSIRSAAGASKDRWSRTSSGVV